MVDFIESPLFYYVPIFGWLKLTLVSYVAKDMVMCLLGIGLLLLGLIIVYIIFVNYKGDFYEQALADSLDLSKRMKSFKAANQDAMRNTKVKTNISGKFKQGVYAILSENILLMKKNKSIINNFRYCFNGFIYSNYYF